MSLLSATDKVKAEASLKSCMNTPSKTPLIEYAALERAMFCSHDALLKNVSSLLCSTYRLSLAQRKYNAFFFLGLCKCLAN